MQMSVIKQFLRLEAASGIILFAMAVLALILNNSPLAGFYQTIFQKSSLFWINDGLMTFFFLLVCLEIKRELIEGELSRVSQVILPGVAALGGMLIPALIYIGINFNNGIMLQGWSIPVATDIAFALGVLSLFGKRVPLSLKLFLMSLAIFDDIGAMVIIAGFYTKSLALFPLMMSVVVMLCLYLLGKRGVTCWLLYLLLASFLWVCLLKSGIHPTLTGVLLAAVIPHGLFDLEKKLHPWVAYFIMPIFALANAGFSFAGITWETVTHPVFLGVMLGLFFGKQLGVLGFAWLTTLTKWVSLPSGCSWLSLYGVALIAGVGFTMSLFLGTLAFGGQSIFVAEIRLGVLVASVLSSIVGAIVLQYALSKTVIVGEE